MLTPIRDLWLNMTLNVVAASVNLYLAITNLNEGRWSGIVSLVAVTVSLWAVWYVIKQYQRRIAQDRQRVQDILSGNIG